jgi:hypothetical protein
LALWPQYGHLAGRRRDLGDILDVDVGHCRSCIATPLTVCLVVLGRHVERLVAVFDQRPEIR